MMNREFCKEILLACGIDNQTDVNICLISRALSFLDCYWICAVDSDESWSRVNLFENEFSINIVKVAITGNLQYVNGLDAIGDKIYTGELTNKGVRAKCFLRHKNKLFLVKKETLNEISSEIVSSYIAQCFEIESAVYVYNRMFDHDCSVCQIHTSEHYEMLPCRDVLTHYRCTMNSESEYYEMFMKVDPIGFISMHLFDYVTLNTDRNRDNFGLLLKDGELLSLYPIFDHDSCFKGKSLDAIYFPTGLTFKRSLAELKSK